MKTYQIKIGGKTRARLYVFIDTYGRVGIRNFVDASLSEIPFLRDVGYAGFKSKVALRKHLRWAVFGKEETTNPPIINEKIEAQAVKIIKNALVQCQRIVGAKGVIKLFLFPTCDLFVRRKMRGATGASFWRNAITLFVHPGASDWKGALEKTVCHEYSHAVRHRYQRWETLLDGIVSEGLAEQFREAVIGGKPSRWSMALSEAEAMKIFQRLKPLLGSKSRSLYVKVFYEGKKFPLWTGYSIGYHLVKRYLSAMGSIDWEDILRRSSKEICEWAYEKKLLSRVI